MRTLFAFLLAAASAIPAVAQNNPPRPAPEFAITMPDGSQKLLSSYKGKATCLAFFFTTCPHCQDMSKLLSSQIAPEYAPKGVQFLAVAFDDTANKSTVSDFANNYVHGAFPMGYADRGQVLEFLQKSIMTPLYVPIMVFIDRKGMIIDEYIGDAKFLADPPKNVRAELDKTLAHAPAKAAVTRISRK